MVFCRCCGKELHESAPTCPHCGGVQHPPQHAATAAKDNQKWLGVTALVLGIICTLILFDDEPIDSDTTRGFVVFAGIAIVCGSISIKNYTAGKKMAIAGIVLSSISLLVLLGMHTK